MVFFKLILFFTILSLVFCNASIENVDVEDTLGRDGNLTALYSPHKEECILPILCWPGICIVEGGKQKCLCPEGYYAKSGLCNRITRMCKFSFKCSPGYCTLIGHKEVCFCPPGYYSNNGDCTEIEPKCRNKNCTPGLCNMQRGIDSCLCPQGFTSQNGTCIEIKFSASERTSIIMMMALVAGASIIVTTLFGIGICYYFRQRNVI